MVGCLHVCVCTCCPVCGAVAACVRVLGLFWFPNVDGGAHPQNHRVKPFGVPKSLPVEGAATARREAAGEAAVRAKSSEGFVVKCTPLHLPVTA